MIEAKGTIKEIQDYILSQSPKPQPMFALAASISVMSVVLGRRYVFDKVTPNLYSLILGGSGSGKHAPQECAQNILIHSHLSTLLGSGSYVSDASLMDTLENKPERLDILDEAGGILKTVTQGSADHSGKMADILCNLWSTSNSLFLGRTLGARSSKKCPDCRTSFTEPNTKGRCYRPSVSLIMATTQTGLEEAVTLSALDKGLLGRFLVFEGQDDAQLNLNFSNEMTPQSIIQRLEQIRSTEIPLNDKYQFSGVRHPVKEVPIAPNAKEYYNECFSRIQSLASSSSLNIALSPIIARIPQQMKKLALIHAAGNCPDPASIFVSKEDLEFGFNLAMYNLEQFEGIIDKYLYRTNLEKEYKVALRTINKYGTLSIDELVYELRPFLKRRRVMEVINELVSSNEIKQVQFDTGEIGVEVND
jgi:hypothetical protein